MSANRPSEQKAKMDLNSWINQYPTIGFPDREPDISQFTAQVLTIDTKSKSTLDEDTKYKLNYLIGRIPEVKDVGIPEVKDVVGLIAYAELQQTEAQRTKSAQAAFTNALVKAAAGPNFSESFGARHGPLKESAGPIQPGF